MKDFSVDGIPGELLKCAGMIVKILNVMFVSKGKVVYKMQVLYGGHTLLNIAEEVL